MSTIRSGDRTTTADPPLWALVYVIVYKQVMLMLRYPLNAAAMFVVLVGFFAGIFYGGSAVAGPALTDSLGGIIVGFFLWTLATGAYSGISRGITKEAQWGTLEQLFMSPHGFKRVIVVMVFSNMLVGFFWSGLVLLAMMLISGRWLHVDPFTVVPILVLTLCTVIGLGLVFGGLALVYKRIENIFTIVKFGLVALIAAPAGEVFWFKLLPLSQGSHLLQVAMEDGVRLWEFPLTELGVLAAVGAGYLVIGYYCFNLAQLHARREGLMGQY